MHIDLPLTPDEESMLRNLAREQRREPEQLVLDNLRVSMRDYSRQRANPQPQRMSALVVDTGAGPTRNRRSMARV